MSVRRAIFVLALAGLVLAGPAGLADELRVTVSQAEVMPLIVQQIRLRLNVEAVALGIINSFTEEVVLKAAYGVWEQFIGTALPLGQGVAAILRTGSMYANNNIADDPRILRPQLLQGMSAVLGVPLIADHGPLAERVTMTSKGRAMRPFFCHFLSCALERKL